MPGDVDPEPRTRMWLVLVLGVLVLAGVIALQLLDDAEDAVPRSSPVVVESR